MNVSWTMARKMFWRGLRNTMQDKPLSISFEITHYCTANCWHCNWGGPVKGEERASPEEFGRLARELRPVVVNISGGEPLARNDVYDIVRAIANPGDVPWMVLVSNGAVLTLDKYHKLREAGINQFSISLDFPDKRHSDFRRIPGLFEKLDTTIPKIIALGHGDLSLNVCLTNWNLYDAPGLVECAERWGTQVNFSVYTPLRVDDEGGLPPNTDREKVRAVFQQLVDMKRAGKPVYTSAGVLWKYYRFLVDRGMPDCQAGRKFLVINPDAMLTPCAMVWAKYRTQEEMLTQFTCSNTCEMCYISTRANTEKTARDFFRDNWELLLNNLPWKRNGRTSPTPA